MEDKLTIVLEQLGTDGITAFYAFLALEYVSLWILIGLTIWGARAVWKKIRDGL